MISRFVPSMKIATLTWMAAWHDVEQLRTGELDGGKTVKGMMPIDPTYSAEDIRLLGYAVGVIPLVVVVDLAVGVVSVVGVVVVGVVVVSNFMSRRQLHIIINNNNDNKHTKKINSKKNY
jgi:hypothetical protein